MHESRRSRQYRESNRRRKESDNHFSSEEEFSFFLADPSSINQTIEAASTALRSQLEGEGIITSKHILDGAGIYQKAFTQLTALITETPLDQSLKEGAYYELLLVANRLLDLFSGGVALHKRTPASPLKISTCFEGYCQVDEETHRLMIDQVLRDIYSQETGKTTSAFTQIYIKQILGRSTRGGAIAGSDSQIRCGLRHTYSPDEFYHWAVTFDSGLRDDQMTPHRIIRPLSQAIFEVKKCFGLEQDERSNPYAFHYKDLESSSKKRYQAPGEFLCFSNGLNRLFNRCSKC